MHSSTIDASLRENYNVENSDAVEPSTRQSSGYKNTGYQNKQNTDENEIQTSPTSKLASFFRFAGAGAVIFSALLYMLQGVDTVDLNIRNWVYLILMSVMAVGGYICRYKFSDALGARLFFALAVLLVPVQFSQLGGMLFPLISPETSSLSGIWAFENISQLQLLISGGVASVLAILLSYTGFSILARHRTLQLVAAFMLLNFALLLPFRFSLLGLVSLAAMLIMLVGLNLRIFSSSRIFSTKEGMVLRCVMGLPFAIALARAGFHHELVTGLSAMMWISAFYITYFIPAWFKNKAVYELCLALGAVVASLAWFLFAISVFASFSSAFSLGLALAPLIGLLFAARLRTQSATSVYSTLAAAFSLFLGWLLIIADSGLANSTLALGVGVSMVAWGIGLQEKKPMVAGAVVSLAGFISLLVISLSEVSINIWLVLGVAGVVLVLFSSVIEKHGKQLFSQAQRFWSMA